MQACRLMEVRIRTGWAYLGNSKLSRDVGVPFSSAGKHFRQEWDAMPTPYHAKITIPENSPRPFVHQALQV